MATVNELYKPVLASFAPYWEKVAGSGNVKSFQIQLTAFALLIDRLPQAIIIFLAVAFGIEGLQAVLASLPAFVLRGMSAASSMMTGVGFAILTAMIWDPQIGVFFFAGFVLAKYLGLPTLAIAILAFTVAITYFFIQKQILDSKAKAVETKNDEEDFF